LRYEWHRRIRTIALAGALIASAAPVVAQDPAKWGTPLSHDPGSAVPPTHPLEVTDEVGRRVKLPFDIKRIVTLAPNLTETVYALGLQDRLVADTNFCDTPPAAKAKAHVGDPQNPNLEAIVALQPDLVLATTSINRVETADALKQLGFPVYTTDPQTVRGMLDSVQHMASAMGEEKKGAELVGRLQKRLDALHARLSDRPMVHVLFVVWDQPLITIGQNTFIADALRFAGAESAVLSKQQWPHLSIEEVVRLQPDYIVFTSDHGPAAATLASLRARPIWRDLDAVETGHVINVSVEAIRPSPGLVDAIEQLAHDVHPEVFAEKSETGHPKFETRNAKLETDAMARVSREIEEECSQCAR
jgi:iron complex transport system substrate-binding protein